MGGGLSLKYPKRNVRGRTSHLRLISRSSVVHLARGGLARVFPLYWGDSYVAPPARSVGNQVVMVQGDPKESEKIRTGLSIRGE